MAAECLSPIPRLSLNLIQDTPRETPTTCQEEVIQTFVAELFEGKRVNSPRHQNILPEFYRRFNATYFPLQGNIEVPKEGYTMILGNQSAGMIACINHLVRYSATGVNTTPTILNGSDCEYHIFRNYVCVKLHDSESLHKSPFHPRINLQIVLQILNPKRLIMLIEAENLSEAVSMPNTKTPLNSLWKFLKRDYWKNSLESILFLIDTRKGTPSDTIEAYQIYFSAILSQYQTAFKAKIKKTGETPARLQHQKNIAKIKKNINQHKSLLLTDFEAEKSAQTILLWEENNNAFHKMMFNISAKPIDPNVKLMLSRGAKQLTKYITTNNHEKLKELWSLSNLIADFIDLFDLGSTEKSFSIFMKARWRYLDQNYRPL